MCSRDREASAAATEEILKDIDDKIVALESDIRGREGTGRGAGDAGHTS